MLIRPGEKIQAYIDLSGNVVAAVRLEYTQDGGLRWHTEKDPTNDDMSYTGTQATPLSGLVCQEFVLNESPKNKLYRWRCTSYTSGTLTTYMDQQSQMQISRGSFRIPGSSELYFIWDNDEPTSGADGDGAGYAGHGSLYFDTSNDGRVYYNQATKDMVSWTTL